MPEKPAQLPPAPRTSHTFGPFDGQVRGHIPQGRDRDAEGHLLTGPVRAKSPTLRLMGDSNDAPPAPPPHIARVQQRARRKERQRIADRHAAACARLAAAIRGEPVGRNRAA